MELNKEIFRAVIENGRVKVRQSGMTGIVKYNFTGIGTFYCPLNEDGRPVYTEDQMERLIPRIKLNMAHPNIKFEPVIRQQKELEKLFEANIDSTF